MQEIDLNTVIQPKHISKQNSRKMEAYVFHLLHAKNQTECNN